MALFNELELLQPLEPLSSPASVGQSAGIWRVVAGKMYARALYLSIFKTSLNQFLFRGGYSHVLTIRVCAAVQGMVFKPFLLRTGYRNHIILGQEQGVKFEPV